MKILVFSDSHGVLSFMRQCVRAIRPDAVIHLGDHYGDGGALAGENPGIPFYRVPGNCDLHREFLPDPETKVERIFGVPMYITHGHRHGVKKGLYPLLADARAAGVRAVLFGHTHSALCRQEADGLWVLNPGACGFSGSAGIMEVEHGQITVCRLLKQGNF